MITLKEGQYLGDLKDEKTGKRLEIPSNCILSKRIPGCGATTLELETDRSSIIVVPNVPVIVIGCYFYCFKIVLFKSWVTESNRSSGNQSLTIK